MNMCQALQWPAETAYSGNLLSTDFSTDSVCGLSFQNFNRIWSVFRIKLFFHQKVVVGGETTRRIKSKKVNSAAEGAKQWAHYQIS